MGLFEKKPIALAMLGNIDIVKALDQSKVFEPYNIKLLIRDIVTIEELFEAIKENKNAEYVLISDTALFGQENGKYEIIKNIREAYPDIFIVMFMNDEKPDETYKNWAFGYQVYNIYYADSEGHFDFTGIMPQIAKKAMPIRQDADLSEKEKELEQKQDLIKEKELELKEKEAAIQVLENQLKAAESLEPNTKNDEEINTLIEKINEAQTAKSETENMMSKLLEQHEAEKEALKKETDIEKKEYYKKVDEEAKAQIEEIKEKLKAQEKVVTTKPKNFSCVTIGVFSISRGAGATYTAIEVAENLAKAGYPTAIIAFDDKKDLLYKGNGYAEYIVPEAGDKKVRLLETITKGYNFIVLDFGNLFPISPLGQLEIGESRITDKKEETDEFIRCQYKIGVGFSEPWHIGKLNWFSESGIADPYTSLFAIKGIENIKGLNQYEISLCERNNELINEVIFEWLGLIRKAKEPQTKKGLFSKREKGREDLK